VIQFSLCNNNKYMKISIITSPFGTIPPTGIGAVEKLWYDLSLEFNKDGYETEIFCKKDKENITRIKKEKIIEVIGYERKGNLFIELFLDLVFTINCFFKLKKTDILIGNTFFSPLIARLFKFKFDKLIYNVQRVPKGQFFLYKNVNNFICPSSIIKTILTKEKIGNRVSVVVIGNPVNLDIYQPKSPKFKLKTDEFQILYFGRIHKEKGLHVLVKALSILSSKGFKLKLKLIGPYKEYEGGSGNQYFNDLKKCFNNIDYVKPISSPEILSSHIHESDIFCYPSLAEKGETFGVSVIEAMACGKPVVVSALSCFTDFVDDCKNGMIFNHKYENNFNDLAVKIELLIENKDLRETLSQNAVETSKFYSNDYISRKHINNFKELYSD
jgi:glycosyltransferase involved in cell wall biosynthesis